MLHHVSFTAKDPKRVATILAELINGRVSRFGPQSGGYIAWTPDSAGTAIEIYPHGTELSPGDDKQQAQFQHNYFSSKRTATHAAISVDKTEEEVFAIGLDQGWKVSTHDRGGFEVIEFWVEDAMMIEIFTPAMLKSYLSVVKSPRVAASGDTIDSLTFKAVIATDPSSLFEAWTSADALQKWWPIPNAKIDLRIGGKYELIFLSQGSPGTRGSEACRILSYVPDQMLSFTWNSPSHMGLRDAQTWVVMNFKEVDGGTEISLNHCGFLTGDDWDQCRAYFQQAWRRVLRRLVSHWNQDLDLRPHSASIKKTSSSASAIGSVFPS